MEICVVVVTYNRVSLLKKALECYDKQTKRPIEIIVVDNGSTDGTSEYLREWNREQVPSYIKTVISTGKNLGGAGGFARGMQEAIKRNYEYVFLADDDAFADPDAFITLDRWYNKRNDKSKIGAICTSVLNCGKYAKGHRRTIQKRFFTIVENSVPDEWYSKESFAIDQLTFVGAAIKSSVIKKIGLPKEEYFFQYDDIEYSSRIRAAGYDIYCIPRSCMHHDTGIENIAFTWKNYYSARNKLNYACKNFSKTQFKFYRMIFYIKNCSIIARISKRRTPQQIRMFRTALKDSNDNMGISDIYKPGVNIEEL